MIGDKIKELRKLKGLTLKELGRKVNISPSFLSDIENNRTLPSLSRLKILTQALDVSVCELLNENCSIHEGPTKSYSPEADIFYSENKRKQEILKELQEEIKDISSWEYTDIQELISYLKAKRLVRDTTNQGK